MNFGAILKASGWIVGVSILTFLAGLFLVPIVVLRMPADFFVKEETSGWHFPQSGLGWVWWVFRNIFGAVLIVSGIAMLVLPGQGILTIAAGLMALTIPGKRRIALWLVHAGGIQRTLNWIRKKGHKPKLLFAPPRPSHSKPANNSGDGGRTQSGPSP